MTTPEPPYEAARPVPEPFKSWVPFKVSVTLEGKAVVGPKAPVPVRFEYDPQDPFAVTLWFDDDQVSWGVSRELLADGLRDHAGQGDLRLWPTDTGEIEMLFESPDGWVIYQFSEKLLTKFLADTYEVVARGKEMEKVDIDQEIDRLLRR